MCADDPDLTQSSVALAKHGRKVMEAVGKAVEGLSDAKSLIPMLQSLGATHAKYGL
jgi:hypothetical protein